MKIYNIPIITESSRTVSPRWSFNVLIIFVSILLGLCWRRFLCFLGHAEFQLRHAGLALGRGHAGLPLGRGLPSSSAVSGQSVGLVASVQSVLRPPNSPSQKLRLPAAGSALGWEGSPCTWPWAICGDELAHRDWSAWVSMPFTQLKTTQKGHPSQKVFLWWSRTYSLLLNLACFPTHMLISLTLTSRRTVVWLHIKRGEIWIQPLLKNTFKLSNDLSVSPHSSQKASSLSLSGLSVLKLFYS